MTATTADQKTLVPSSSEERDQQLVEYLRDLALEQMPAEELLRWAIETFPGRAVLNTSFQYTGVAMIHMATSMGLNLRFATIDTLRLHPETYAFMEEVRARYGCHFEVVQPKRGDVERMVARHGEYLFSIPRKNRSTAAKCGRNGPTTRCCRPPTAGFRGSAGTSPSIASRRPKRRP